MSTSPAPPQEAAAWHRALAWAVLLVAGALLTFAAACAAVVLYACWDAARPPDPAAVPEVRDATGAEFFAWVAGLLSLGLGSAAWWAGRRLPGAPARLRAGPG